MDCSTCPWFYGWRVWYVLNCNCVVCFKNITKKFWTPKVEKWIKISCWALNIGLAGMVFVTLMPVGYIQLKDALEHGYWHSRLTSFYEQPLVKAIMWGECLGTLYSQ